MNWYRADLHIHTVLSPCGDLDMSPTRIIQEAIYNNLNIIGVTDHNSTYHTELMVELGRKTGLTVFPGVEVNTREEVHCLGFFENTENTKLFQEFIDVYIPDIKNQPNRFGEQMIVNEKEEIIGEIDKLLISGLNIGINEVEKKIHELDGIFIPAHIDRPMNGVFSQLGFIPESLKIDALEFSYSTSREKMISKRSELLNYSLITNSDAHFPEQIARSVTKYYLEEPTFNEWKMALRRENGRKVKTQ